ncbi:hypothetical protein ACOME3_001211 [Neoechinorhynchus agilis]
MNVKVHQVHTGQSVDRSIASIKRSGVVYLSRIPTRMTVSDVHAALTQYGEVGRIYLKPDESVSHSKQFKFNEGWVEFRNKKVAKLVAANLNNRQVEGKSRKVPWYYDLWNIRYMPKLKWSHIKEENAQRQIMKRKHLAQELKLGKKEADYLDGCLEKSKRIKKKVEKCDNDELGSNIKATIKQQDWVFQEKPMSADLIRRIFNAKRN